MALHIIIVIFETRGLILQNIPRPLMSRNASRSSGRMSLSKEAMLFVSNRIDQAVDIIPSRWRKRISETVELLTAGVALCIPFLYALGNSESSFLEKSSIAE